MSTLRSSRQRPREPAVYQATASDVFWGVQAPSRNHKARSAHEWGTEGRGRAPDPLLLARASKSVNRAQEDHVFTFWGAKGGPEQPRTNRARDTVDTDTERPAGPAAGETRGSLRGPPVGSASQGALTLGTAGPETKAHRGVCVCPPPAWMTIYNPNTYERQ